jgi:hypothetical protein
MTHTIAKNFLRQQSWLAGLKCECRSIASRIHFVRTLAWRTANTANYWGTHTNFWKRKICLKKDGKGLCLGDLCPLSQARDLVDQGIALVPLGTQVTCKETIKNINKKKRETLTKGTVSWDFRINFLSQNYFPLFPDSDIFYYKFWSCAIQHIAVNVSAFRRRTLDKHKRYSLISRCIRNNVDKSVYIICLYCTVYRYCTSSMPYLGFLPLDNENSPCRPLSCSGSSADWWSQRRLRTVIELLIPSVHCTGLSTIIR